MSDKVVLAYSGGLDTTYCAVWLNKVKHLEIHALTVNTGGFSAEEIDQIARRAKSLGAFALAGCIPLICPARTP